MARMDDLEKWIKKKAKENPDFPSLVDAALERRELLKKLTLLREKSGLTQGQVAELMGTKQPNVSRLESLNTDVDPETVDKYAAVFGYRVQTKLVKVS